jgi:hypothetical protein
VTLTSSSRRRWRTARATRHARNDSSTEHLHQVIRTEHGSYNHVIRALQMKRLDESDGPSKTLGVGSVPMNHEMTEGTLTVFSSSFSLARRGGGASRSRSRSQVGLLYLLRPPPWPSHRSRSRPGGEAALALLYCGSDSLRLWSGEEARLCCRGAAGVVASCGVPPPVRSDVWVSVRPSELVELLEVVVPLLCRAIATPRSRAAIASVE